ncbi:MAG: hypothetical protein KGZ25_03715, partial [Planctomycetes bacterium]|nr:hypothetical protein [Planctomycetota bacterium]
IWEGTTKTDKHGNARVEPELAEDLSEGDYTLRVRAKSAAGKNVVSRTISVERSFRIMVSSDKPLYQPGQTIHMRTLSLFTSDLHPVADQPATIEVKDAKGNKVFKKTLKTSQYGIAAADFQLADQVNTGRYTISAHVGDTTSERTVTVKRYRLPKFKATISCGKPFYRPGEMLIGEITARYTFGKPVRNAEVQVTASEFVEKFRQFASAEGKTNAEGHFSFQLPLKRHFTGTARKKGDATVSLKAKVTDTAGHTQEITEELTVTTRPIRVAVLPESGKLVQGVENILYIVTSYPDGRPAQTELIIGADRRRTRTAENGVAKVKITPRSPRMKLTIEAEDNGGRRVKVSRPLRVDQGVHAFLLRTDKAVYKAGETAEVSVLSGDRRARVFVDVVKNSRTMLSKALDIEKGRGSVALDLPPDLFGTLELHAYRILPDGNIVSDAKVVQVNRPDQLSIEAKMDKKTYRPGENATLTFMVTGTEGKPTQAALGLAGVDEAVFALQEMRPGLERVYFTLQEEILKPSYEIHGHMPLTAEEAIEPRGESEPQLKEARVALFSAAEGTATPRKAQSISFEEKQRRFRKVKVNYRRAVLKLAAQVPFALYVLFVLPMVGYGLYKLFRRRPVPELNAKEMNRLRRACWWLTAGWLLALVIPVTALIVGLLTDELIIENAFARYHGELFSGSFAVIAWIGMLIALIAIVFKFRKSPGVSNLPLFRKFATLLPFAYIAASVSVITLGVAKAELGLAEETVVLEAGIMIGLWFAALPALSIAGHSVCQKLSTKRAVWIAVRTGALPLLALLVFAGLLLPALSSARMAARQKFGEMTEALDGAPVRGAAMGSKKAAGESLKAPTRVRDYFPETLLWKPELITDERGRAQLEVPLADSITTWRISMSAVSGQGRLGAEALGLRVFQDFFVDIDFPVALTQHDEISVPIALYNYLDETQLIRLEVDDADWCEMLGETERRLEIGPREVTSVPMKLRALKPGRHTLTVRAFGSEMADAIRRKVRVRPDGKEIVQTDNGRLTGKLNRTVVIPDRAIDGASDLLVKIYPGAFSQVMEGLDSIFRKPFGCFEQTSSVTYPNILVLDYMRRTDQSKPEIEMKALNYINLGYQRLLSYEVSGGGFEWFGNAPAHNVLTAYGLMEFNDMAKVYEVDPAVIQRTRRWLFSQQKRNGSWEPSRGGIQEGAINAYQGAVLRTTAYIAWALAESGNVESDLSRALDYVERNVSSDEDAYTLAVCTNALVAGGRSDAGKLLKMLDATKKTDGDLVHWSSESEGVTHSRGNVLDIETTALAAYAMLKAQSHLGTAHKALAWLIEKKDSAGTWHSTQATVHAMRALLAGTGPATELKKDLPITISVNGKLAKELTITPETSEVFRLISLREYQERGTNRISLEPAGEANLAYQIVATHYLPWERKTAPDQKAMSIDVAYNTKKLRPDDKLACEATIRYNRKGVARMTIVDLGIPPGFQVMTEDFDRLKEQGLIQRYSLTGRQVILYFESIASDEPVRFTYHLRAKYPVKAKTPPTEVYQYYEPEVRDATQPVEIEVQP